MLCILTFLCVVFTPAQKAGATSADSDDVVKVNEIDDSTTPNSFELNIASNAGSTQLSSTLQILLVLTVISVAPSILLMVTSFTRIVVVLHFTRSALGTNTTPPNQVIVGLALVLTFFIMSPTFTEVYDNALKPLNDGEITQEEALEAGIEPLKEFMLGQTRRKDLRLFMDIAEIETVDEYQDLPLTVVIPSFMISELRAAFIIGFVIYIPFLVIDMVVASTLMSMGMMMLPPTTISMPFKILLFIMADGWNLIVGEVVKSFTT
jgi:flagellar biosynthetic protein FliP